MKPVHQSRLNGAGPPGVGGNCFAACMATIFELPISALPDPDESGPRHLVDAEWDKWLSQFGLYQIEIDLSLEWIEDRAKPPYGYTIGSVESRRFEGEMHAVVCYDGCVVWDPVPGQSVFYGTRPSIHTIFISKEPWLSTNRPEDYA